MPNNASNFTDDLFFLYILGITVPEDVTHVRVHRSVKSIPAGAFEDCRQLEEVVLPEGLQEIGENTFYGCRLL